jgi:hypothetical protein
MYGLEVMCIQRFHGERDHFEAVRIDTRIILKCIFKRYDRGVDQTDLAQNRDKCRSVVNAVMNLRVL